MISKGAARCTVGVLGGLMLVGVGTAAFADYPDPEGSSGVDVKVDIAEVQNGALSLTVENTETALTETGSTAEYRQFIGALPNVTVTDTRSEVPSGVFWYVTGQASDFVATAGQSPITPDHLGWSPALVTTGNGEVAAGDEVKTSLDESPNNVGLIGEELLSLSLDSASSTAASGQWTAGASLVLKTPVDVAPGAYTSSLTLSLFEDAL
jgi:hypothetical protein